MSLLTVTDLNHTFVDKTLYDHANFKVEKGDHLGIVGQNGVGKSTLIKILTGDILPDSGKITWQKGLQIGYLDQYAHMTKGLTIREFLRTAFEQMFALEQKMNQIYENYSQTLDDDDLAKAGQIQTRLEEAGFYDVETRIETVATGLGITDMGLETDVTELSGGQRSRIILAKLLLQQPDIMLLDEPTNYLDTKHIDWLTDFLQNFSGAYLVISHDYQFLEKITNCILDIEFGQITRYTGDLQSAFKQKEANALAYRRAYTKQQEQIAKSEAYIRKFKAGSRSKSARSREKQLSHMDVLKTPDRLAQPVINFAYEPTASRILITTTDLVIGYDQPLNKKLLEFSVANEQKIVIAGYNGVGKSTLLKTLLGELPSLSGEIEKAPTLKIAYYSQSLQWPHKLATPLQYLQDLYPLEKPKILRQALARTGLTAQQAMSPINELSGGEQSKIKLAQLMLTPANLLILDEPTNHLDDATKAALRLGIQKFPGAALLVTHEMDFYDDSWIDKVINIEDYQK
ncbi:ABC-F family ATP-binding cassette domain-containing protein [Lapidilactobacillus gannanensis]|jgi:ATPase subunit of ABC transporter with duplicated ATPase domains|uniref:ABC-F family ATP-binding cassette domain-containing protein n=1 Tax=Lapidilactobacillus gannanensis TaxID=2486002 RepID=A0ABW4BN61_9LACO|nr:ABC-F family ATP-binding cassette domain-containing protein [Lapidilactobacillus gannanensis]MCH4056845.1 ATP-binding cassette domain-containing protein [Lactobacillaceae bacterium]